MNVQEVFESIKDASMAEVVELSKMIQEEFDVTPMSAMPAAAAAPGAAPAEEEQTEFNVILVTPGDKKIPVIKVVREITELGLKEAKALVDSAPAPVKEGASKEDAEAIKEKLEEVGAQVELK